jgi:hypothetical protein
LDAPTPLSTPDPNVYLRSRIAENFFLKILLIEKNL